MALKKAKAAAAAPVMIATAMSNKEIALSELATATSRVLHLCLDLAGDANLSPDEQNLFWGLGSRAMQVMMRIEQNWTPLLQQSPPTISDLRNATNAMNSAAAALAAAKANPLPQNLFAAATATSSALDITDSIIDLVA
jgi:hypothetical protein